MKSFNKIAIAAAIIFIALLIIWPLQQSTIKPVIASTSLLTPAILGDGSELARPIPQHIELDKAIVALGERLFNDPEISGNGFSCGSCHQLMHGGIDHRARPLITGGGVGSMNTPTIFNVALNSMQTWTGFFPDLASQLNNVITNPRHFNSNWDKVIDYLQQNDDYHEQFRELFSGDITRQTITHALTTFERSLITPNADFDRYLRGDEHALTLNQKKGYQLFIDYGCISCHQGINLGGNLLSRFGIYQDGFTNKSELSDSDYGRYQLTGRESDKFIFRVPSLRNVAVTAPYFHNGNTATLADAIKTMAKIQLNVAMPEQDVTLIEAFLQSLTGEYQGKKL